MLSSDSPNCWRMQIAPRTRKNVATRTRDELSVNMPPSDMKENNVCSKAVGETMPVRLAIRKRIARAGDRRDSS